MKRLFLLLGLLMATLFGREALALDAKAVTGDYELQNVPEMAGMLALKADGKYLAGFSYGAADWVEEGSWKLEGKAIVFSGSRVKQTNYDKLPLFLPAGSRFEYSKGKLRLLDSERRVVFGRY